MSRTAWRCAGTVVAAALVVAGLAACVGGADVGGDRENSAPTGSESSPDEVPSDDVTDSAETAPQILTQQSAPSPYGTDELIGELWVTESGCLVVQPSGFTGPAQAVAWPPGWSASGDEYGGTELLDETGEFVATLGSRVAVGGQLSTEDEKDGCGLGPVWVAGPKEAVGGVGFIYPMWSTESSDAEKLTESIVQSILDANPQVVGGTEWEYTDEATYIVHLVESLPADAQSVRSEIESAIGQNPDAAAVSFGSARAPEGEIDALARHLLDTADTWASDPSAVIHASADPITGVVAIGVTDTSVAEQLNRTMTLPSGITVHIAVA